MCPFHYFPDVELFIVDYGREDVIFSVVPGGDARSSRRVGHPWCGGGVATALPATLGAGIRGVGRGSGKRSAAPAKRSVSLLRPSFWCFLPEHVEGVFSEPQVGRGISEVRFWWDSRLSPYTPVLLSDNVYPTDKGDICKKSGRLGVRVVRPRDGGPELDLPIHERCAGEVQVRRAVGKRHSPARTVGG